MSTTRKKVFSSDSPTSARIPLEILLPFHEKAVREDRSFAGQLRLAMKEHLARDPKSREELLKDMDTPTKSNH